MSPAISEERPVAGHGGGFLPPTHEDRGGEGSGSDSPDYQSRLRRARLGLLFAMSPILCLFLTFTVAYVVTHRSSTFDERTNAYVHYWTRVNLPTGLLLFNTLLLMGSSVMIEMARRRLAQYVALSPLRSIPGISVGGEGVLPWVASTVILGIMFLGGQVMAWRTLYAQGFYFSSSAAGSFVFLITGAHAIHLVGGIGVLLYALVIYFLRRPVESRHIVVDVTAWYWHFMLLLWICIFGLLEVVR
jgi:cytochrome c oxidase subunit III